MCEHPSNLLQKKIGYCCSHGLTLPGIIRLYMPWEYDVACLRMSAAVSFRRANDTISENKPLLLLRCFLQTVFSQHTSNPKSALPDCVSNPGSHHLDDRQPKVLVPVSGSSCITTFSGISPASTIVWLARKLSDVQCCEPLNQRTAPWV